MGNVLVISDNINGFFASSVCNEMINRKINIFKAGFDDDRINTYLADSKLIFLLLGDEFDSHSIFFAGVKKKLKESTNKIVAYGSASKIEDIKTVFSKDRFLETFVRPADNAVIAVKISIVLEEMDEASKEAACISESTEKLAGDNSGDADEVAKESAENVNVEESALQEEKKNILVVDDSGQMLRTILGWLEGKYNVRLANSAETAAVSINKDIPDLILLDYEMPEVSGPEFFVQLREKERTKDIPVIFLTAQNDADSVRAVLELRPQGYILKTTASTTLVEKLDDFFRKQNK